MTYMQLKYKTLRIRTNNAWTWNIELPVFYIFCLFLLIRKHEDKCTDGKCHPYPPPPPAYLAVMKWSGLKFSQVHLWQAIYRGAVDFTSWLKRIIEIWNMKNGAHR